MVQRTLMGSLIVLGTAIAGCNTTELLMPPGGNQSTYAPVNEATRPGLIRYVWSNDQDTERARRMDAYERMWHACDGKYRILDEEAARSLPAYSRPPTATPTSRPLPIAISSLNA